MDRPRNMVEKHFGYNSLNDADGINLLVGAVLLLVLYFSTCLP